MQIKDLIKAEIENFKKLLGVPSAQSWMASVVVLNGPRKGVIKLHKSAIRLLEFQTADINAYSAAWEGK